MGIFDFIGSIFKPAADLIDNLHTSDEERMELQKQMMKIQTDLHTKLLEYETKLMEARSSIITAEANSQSWIARNWRPITMLTFLVLVVLSSIGILGVKVHDEFWAILKIGLGGYVIGRSAEKIVPQVMKRREMAAKG
jgi:hypothetical protein